MRTAIQRTLRTVTGFGLGLVAGGILLAPGPTPVSDNVCRSAIAWADQVISDYASAYKDLDSGRADGTFRYDQQQTFHRDGSAYVTRRDECLGGS